MSTLDTWLSQLENAQLVRRLAEQELAYLFKHTLTQETAYGSLLTKKRREIHRLVAEAYEQSFPLETDEYAPLLAEHYWQAGDQAKALEYATRAGDAAGRIYANAEAAAHYRRALDIAKREEAASASLFVHLYTRLGRTLELMGRYKEAIQVYEDMERLAKERGEPPMELQALLARATLNATPTSVFDPGEGQLLSERALAIARDLNDHAAEAKLLWNLELLYWFTNRPQESARYGEQSVALARRYDLREQLAFSLSDLSFPYLFLGQTERAESVVEEARVLLEQLDNKPMLANSLASSAENNYFLGEFERAMARSAEALHISEGIGNLWGQSYSQMYPGYVYWERGDPAAAIHVMGECIRLAEEAGFAVPRLLTRADLGVMYAQLGAVEQGMKLVREAQEFAERTKVFVFWAEGPLARLLASSGKWKEAEEILRKTRSKLPSGYSGDSYMAIPMGIPRAEIELALEQSDYARAADAALRLVEQLERSKMRAWLPEALYLLGRAFIGEGRREEAYPRLGEARSLAEALGSRWTLWEILAVLSGIEGARGNHTEAQNLRGQAAALVRYIAAHTPPELREGFLQQTHIRALTEA